MVEPVAEKSAEGMAAKLAACWKARMSLWIGLIVLLVAVVGELLIYAVPGQYFIQSEAGDYFYSHAVLLQCLQVVANAGVYLGTIWVGVYLARWGVGKKKA
jgi:hypothetical protein